MRKLMLAVLTVAAIAAPGGARAATTGCTAAGANQNTGPVACSYTAAGPGSFVAATMWPYQISASSDHGSSWRALVDEQRFGKPTAGPLATRYGDLVRVQIGCWNDGRACLGYCPPGAAHTVNCTYEGSRAGVVTALDR